MKPLEKALAALATAEACYMGDTRRTDELLRAQAYALVAIAEALTAPPNTEPLPPSEP